MSKNKEQLYNIIKKEMVQSFPPKSNYIDWNNAVEFVLSSMRKQIPQKPIPFTETWSDRIFYKCPICGDNWNMDEFGDGMEYCWTCGQAIDWNVGD